MCTPTTPPHRLVYLPHTHHESPLPHAYNHLIYRRVPSLASNVRPHAPHHPQASLTTPVIESPLLPSPPSPSPAPLLSTPLSLSRAHITLTQRGAYRSTPHPSHTLRLLVWPPLAPSHRSAHIIFPTLALPTPTPTPSAAPLTPPPCVTPNQAFHHARCSCYQNQARPTTPSTEFRSYLDPYHTTTPSPQLPSCPPPRSSSTRPSITTI